MRPQQRSGNRPTSGPHPDGDVGATVIALPVHRKPPALPVSPAVRARARTQPAWLSAPAAAASALALLLSAVLLWMFFLTWFSAVGLLAVVGAIADLARWALRSPLPGATGYRPAG